MGKRLRVTPSQVAAAKILVKRSAVTGRYVSPGVKAIANADGQSYRSARSGRFVSSSSAVRSSPAPVDERSAG